MERAKRDLPVCGHTREKSPKIIYSFDGNGGFTFTFNDNQLVSKSKSYMASVSDEKASRIPKAEIIENEVSVKTPAGLEFRFDKEGNLIAVDGVTVTLDPAVLRASDYRDPLKLNLAKIVTGAKDLKIAEFQIVRLNSRSHPSLDSLVTIHSNGSKCYLKGRTIALERFNRSGGREVLPKPNWHIDAEKTCKPPGAQKTPAPMPATGRPK